MVFPFTLQGNKAACVPMVRFAESLFAYLWYISLMVSSTCPVETGNTRQDQLDPGYHGIGLSMRLTILSATVINSFVSSEDSTFP